MADQIEKATVELNLGCAAAALRPTSCSVATWCFLPATGPQVLSVPIQVNTALSPTFVSLLCLTGLWVYGQRRSLQFGKTPLNSTVLRCRGPASTPSSYWMKRCFIPLGGSS